MIFDQTTLFSDAQAITATAYSTNIIDLGAMDPTQARDVGKGKKIPLLVQVVETFDSAADDETLTITLRLDSTETMTPDKTIALGAFPIATLVEGFQIPFDVVPKGVNLRYAALHYAVSGSGNFTAGKITAGIVMGVQTNG